MFFTQFKRATYLGILNLVRNSFVSFSAIFVMTVALFIIGFSLLFAQVMDAVTDELREKVDVTVYFVSETSEGHIFEFREKLLNLSQVKDVIYVSQETALEEYKKRHENDPDILRGLEILDKNPFRSRLSIRAKQSSDFESIAKFIENEDILSDNPVSVIDKIDYYQNREVILRLTSVIDTIKTFSNVVISLIIFIAFLIVFNIIRLIIYLSRDEIKVMRLIGADDLYVRSPFLVSGGIYGFIGGLIATALLYPISFWVSPSIERFFGSEGLYSYYVSEFFLLIITLIFIGIVVGVVSSYLSTRRYLDD